MKATELIAELQKLVEEHGDGDVVYLYVNSDMETDIDDIETIEFRELVEDTYGFDTRHNVFEVI